MDDGAPRAGAPVAAGTARPSARSEQANRALWLGVLGMALGFLLMFAVLTPAAIVLGVRGLREIRAAPELTGRSRAWTGIGLAIAAPLLWLGVFVAFLADGVA